jgi:hypothetical protein
VTISIVLSNIDLNSLLKGVFKVYRMGNSPRCREGGADRTLTKVQRAMLPVWHS